MRAADVARRALRVLAPPPDLRPSAWCDRELVVTAGPLAGARWKTLAYQRSILDAFDEPGVEYVIVRSSAQVGKTAVATGIVAFHMSADPCPILVVEPTVDPMAKDFSRNRLEPVIAASPALAEVILKRRSTALAKTFRGGSLAIAGSGSASSLAARSIRLLVLDEVSRYKEEVEDEGSTLSVALKRTAAFGSRRRVLMLSTPTWKGGAIDVWHDRGDRREFYVPFPCGHEQPLRWADVKWEADDPSTATIRCPECGHAMSDTERAAAVERGRWVSTAPNRPEKNIVSFHLWEAYSPFSSLREIVASFLAARKAQRTGDSAEMRAWQNLVLGESVEPEDGEGQEPHVLLARREEYVAPVPAGACVLVAGADVQDDRIELGVIGFGPGEESFWVDRALLPGDPSTPAPWEMLDALLLEGYRHESGRVLGIEALAIDTAGHRTDHVYEWVSLRQSRRIYGVIGRDGQRPLVSSPSQQKIARTHRTVQLYTVGVDTAKALLMSRLLLSAKGPGFVHLPMADWADEELCEQLTAERLVTTFSRGVARQVWRKQRPRNEATDIFVYALAALRLLHPDLERRAADLGGK